jgi:hypothetical protein
MPSIHASAALALVALLTLWGVGCPSDSLPDRDADCCFNTYTTGVEYDSCVYLCQGDETEVHISTSRTATGPPGTGGGGSRETYACDADLTLELGEILPSSIQEGAFCDAVLERLGVEFEGDDDDSAR